MEAKTLGKNNFNKTETEDSKILFKWQKWKGKKTRKDK